MKKINILTLLFLTLAYMGCKNKNTNSNAATTTTSPSTTTNSLPENLSVKWRFDNKQDENDEPLCDLYLNVNGKEVLVEKIKGIHLNEMSKPYTTEGFPADAILACEGFYAGWGCVMYVRKEGDKLIVVEGTLPEGTDIEAGEKPSISYRTLKTITPADLK